MHLIRSCNRTDQRHRAAASEEELTKLRGELRSLRLDNAETEELVETNRQLDAANKELGAALDAEVRTRPSPHPPPTV